ncbi:glutathione peroxidase [Bacillus sp. AK128]
MSIYDFEIETPAGLKRTLSRYKGKVLLIVNTATKCGFTPQLEDLQKLQARYEAKGFTVLGFPSNQFAEQEPLADGAIEEFCSINYGVNFPIFKKIDVRDENAHPLFKYLSQQKSFGGFDMSHPVSKLLMEIINDRHPEYMTDNSSIKWNFTKFLIDREGNVMARYESTTEPIDFEKEIEALL